MTRIDSTRDGVVLGGSRLVAIALAIAAAGAGFPSRTAAEVIDCTLPGRNSPAVPVPECVNSQGLAVGCGTTGSIKLWPPSGFKPASGFPYGVTNFLQLRPRDSTNRVAGQGLPSRKYGFEAFASVDIADYLGSSKRLHVAYTGGIQAWDIVANPADPVYLGSRDIWDREFIDNPPVGEKLHFIEDISVIAVSPTLDVIATAGFVPMGVSLWEFDSTKPAGTNGNGEPRYRKLYQDDTIDARQVNLVQVSGKIYAVVGGDHGVMIYDVTSARALGTPCEESLSPGCGGALNGSVRKGYVTTAASQYSSAIVVDGKLLATSSNGASFGAIFELWEVNPNTVGSSIKRFSSTGGVGGTAFYRDNNKTYLGLIDEPITDQEVLKIVQVDACLGSNCTLATGSNGSRVWSSAASVALNAPGAEGIAYASTRDFLTYSSYNGDPYLYYGIATGGLKGPNIERLFDVGNLSSITEITAGGGSYSDPCAPTNKIRYWSHYYHSNYRGLNDMVPRVGQFSSAGYFYRASNTVLDVHVLGNGVAPGGGSIATAVTSPQSEYWMGDTIAYTATAGSGCGPSSLDWLWDADTNQTDVVPSQISEVTSSASYKFNCLKLSGRCPATQTTVAAANGACADATIYPATITVKDPKIEIVSANSGATSSFEDCQMIPFAGALAGRSPAWWEWQVNGVPITGCAGSYNASTDLSAANVGCSVEAAKAFSPEIHDDGFESGDTSAWSSVLNNGILTTSPTPTKAKAAANLVAQLYVWDNGTKAAAVDIADVPFSVVESGTPAFSGSPTETVDGSGATLKHPATGTSLWSWEIQDPSGSSDCTFPTAGATKCTKTTTVTDSLLYGWLSAGTYEYRVTVTGCNPGSATRVDQVTVSSGVQPNVQLFGNKSGGVNCCGNVVSGFSCNVGTAYDFVVKMAEPGAFTFKFDWARTSPSGGSFNTESPISNNGTGEYYFKHTFSASGTVYPIARAQSGAFSDDQSYISTPITVGAGVCP